MRCFVLSAALLAACGGWEDPGVGGIKLPAWLNSPCDRDLTAVGARLRVSGHDEACELEMDLPAGRAQGDCSQITTGLERVVALEFVVLFEGQELVLSQQLGRVDLRDLPEAAYRVPVEVADEVITRDCIQRLSPPDRDFSVCDNDGDSVTNLDEYCSGDRDPLRVERIGDP